MKYSVLVFIIFTASFTKAQSYQPLFDANDIYYKIFFIIPDAGFTDSLYLTNDSVIINNTVYHEFSSQISSKIFLRTDSLNEKAWLLNEGDTIEYLIFDLSLNVGDSIKYGNFYNYNWIKVDSVFYLNNLKHIRFDNEIYSYDHFDIFKLTFIEGLGPNIGLQLYPWFFWHIQQQLLCAYKDGIEVYRSADTCEYNFVGIEEKEKIEYVRLKRNPVKDFVELEFDPLLLKDFNIEVYDLNGKNLISSKIYSTSSKIEMSKYPPGLYLIMISIENYRQTLKVMKI